MPAKPSERRVLYLQRKKSGCCPRCGNKVKKSSGFIYCDDCRAFFRGYNEEISDSINKTRQAKYNKRKKNNQCPRCGIKLGKKYTKTICPECLEKQYEYNYGTKRKTKSSVKSTASSKKTTGTTKAASSKKSTVNSKKVKSAKKPVVRSKKTKGVKKTKTTAKNRKSKR
jgi:uncharacterized Zn finger protein (UPF0148 family)